jgi:AcrR family transcriptional regulator
MKKKPTQERSRQTVEALVEATALSIAERGWANVTTNHIAARAGVSVGSLYQYFADREELLAALIDRERARFMARLDATLPTLLDADIRSIVRTVLEISFEEGERDEALFAELANHWHVTTSGAFVAEMESYILDALRVFLAHLYEVFEPMDVPTVAFILTNGAVLVITRYFTVRPRGVTKAKLLDELTDLYAGYLEGKRRAPA